MPLIDVLKEAEIKALEESVDLGHWQDAAAAEGIGTVAAGYKYVVTSITIQNLGAASVLDFYDALAADQAEANHKVSIDAKGTDTTVVTGLNLTFETAASVKASVCAAAHNLKVTLSGVRIRL
jgi:hypothetical protein